MLEPEPRPSLVSRSSHERDRMSHGSATSTVENVRSRMTMTVAKKLLGSLFPPVLTILISTEFNVVALPFCKLSYFESEIPPLSPILRTLLLVLESLSSTYYQVLTYVWTRGAISGYIYVR